MKGQGLAKLFAESNFKFLGINTIMQVSKKNNTQEPSQSEKEKNTQEPSQSLKEKNTQEPS